MCVADEDVEAYARARLSSARIDMARVRFVDAPYDDTWLRDSGPITLREGDGFRLLDFRFTLTGGLINAVQVTMYALAAHVYPSAVRATGVGAASSVGRLGAILSGYAGAWAIDYRGSASYFSLIAVAMAATFISLALVGRHVARVK